ncbi:MAG: cellulose binding domain-containing protein, partial [Planctomycetota bacterium]|nr:cellulose binding domain-containing protein [Planctomycetota bacterium]
DEDGDGIPDACQLDGITGSFTINDDWGSGFTAELVLTNNSQESVDAGWTVQFTSGFEIDNIWPADFQVGPGGAVTVTAPEWANPLNPGDSITIGMQGSYGSGSITLPENVTLNGTVVVLD